jgi:alpha-galactosidase
VHIRSGSSAGLLAALATVAVVGLTAAGGAPASDALAPTPPMGWNSWNKFGCNVSESLIRETADAMAANGMKAAGYQYVVIDDCWQVSRTADGIIVADAKRFPAGIKALADYVHGKGLKFGLYSDAGTQTCQGRPGSHGFETKDATQYAAWGVDYLKYDWCHAEGLDAKTAYTTMRKALDATGRPIVFSMCEWGTAKPWLWARGIGHLWRTTGDISDCFECKNKGDDGLSWAQILDLEAPIASYAGPGGWNDPDMLEVGNGGLTASESRAHFSMWAMLAAPLMAGNDLRSMSAETHEILTNSDVLAIDQDALGKQATRVRDDGDQEVWAKPLADGGEAIALLNRGAAPAQIAVNWSEAGPKAGASKMRNLWTHKDQPVQADGYSATVPSHDVVLIRIYPANR